MTIQEATAQTDEWRRYDVEGREPRRLRLDRPAKVTLRLNEAGMGQVLIDDIEIGNLSYAGDVQFSVGHATTIGLRMRGVSAEIEALCFVEIADDGKAIRS